jgi:biotin carboxyl carrier protein
MQRWINLKNEQYDVKVFGCPEKYTLQVGDGIPRQVLLTEAGSGKRVIQLGNKSTKIQMAMKGDTAYIHAYGRTFTLSIMDPVEQAAGNTGASSNTAKAPMPGVVVEANVAPGDQVTKGQPMVTIESMKMLMVITAPMSGSVSCVHFEPGQTFDKNAVLVSITQEEKK